MNTALGRRLTAEQFTRLKEAVLARRKEILSAQECHAWETKRHRYERIADGDHHCRLQESGYGGGATPGRGGEGTIFDKMNETLGIVKSVRRFLVARVCKDLFGSAPYFYVKPEGATDRDLALKMQKHVDWKLRLADYKNKIKEAVGIALDLGECPLKTTWDVQVDLSERLGTLLTDKSSGQPVLTADGDHLEDTDETTGGDQAMDAQGNPQADASGQPVMNPISFAKAPEIQVDPARHEWREHFVEERAVLYQGLSIAACHWKDVHWPINAPSLEKADFVSHAFDMRWSALRAKYAPNSFTGRAKDAMIPVDEEKAESDDDIANVAQAEGSDSDVPGAEDGPANDSVDQIGDADVMEILMRVKNSSREPKAHEGQPRHDEGVVPGGEVEDPIIKVCEVSYDFDCFEDGILRRLWLVLLPDHDECLYADYRTNISPRAAKPIHLVTVNQVKHRAYGKGLHETYEGMSDIADRLLNHILLRNAMISNPTKIWNPERTKEGKANPSLVIGEGVTYSIDGSQWGPKDILAIVEIPDLDQRTWQLMELFMQLIQVDSGVTNANQGDMTDLPSNTTATGINSMLESSSVLHQYVLEEIRDSLTPHLGYAIELIYKMQDRTETFDYLEQDEIPQAQAAAGQAGAPTPDRTIAQVMALGDAKKLNGLPMNVEFLLTRAKRQEQREAALAGIPQGVQYGQLSDSDKTRMNDAFVQLFRSLGFDHPEKFFPLPDPNAPPPKAQPKASELIALKGTDLAPNQKDALAQQLGLPPAQGPATADAPNQSQSAMPQASQTGGAPAPTALPSNVIPDGSAAPDDTGAKISDRQVFQEPSDAGAQP